MSQSLTKLIPSMLDTALSGVLAGSGSTSNQSGSFVIGNNITTATTNTLYVNNLCATGNGGKIYGDGSSLTGVITTQYTPPANATFTSSVSAPSLSGTFYGDGSKLFGVNTTAALPLSGGTINGTLVVRSLTATSLTAIFLSAGNVYGDGANLTGLNATNISQGTLSNSRLPAVATFTTSVSAPSLSGDGTNLTGLNATNISQGTLNNSRLPAVATFTTSISSPSVSGVHYGDGSNLTKVWGTDTTKLPASGGTIAGNLVINNNLTVGTLTVGGSATFVNTVFSTTSSLSVVNVSPVSGVPALYVGQKGPSDIASFYDIDQNVEVLHIGGVNSIYPNVGIKTSAPNKTLTVVGDISSTLGFYGDGSNLTNLDAADIAQGTLSNSRLPAVATFTTSVSAPSLSGDGTNLTGLNATNISQGTLNNSRLPAVATFTTSVSAPSLSGVHYGTYFGDGSKLTGIIASATIALSASATFALSVSAPSLSGTHYGDGKNLINVLGLSPSIGTDTYFNVPYGNVYGSCTDLSGNYIGGYMLNGYTVWKYDPTILDAVQIASVNVANCQALGGPHTLTADNAGNLFYINNTTFTVQKLRTSDSTMTNAASGTRIGTPTMMANALDSSVYTSDTTLISYGAVYKVSPTYVVTLSGTANYKIIGSIDTDSTSTLYALMSTSYNSLYAIGTPNNPLLFVPNTIIDFTIDRSVGSSSSGYIYLLDNVNKLYKTPGPQSPGGINGTLQYVRDIPSVVGGSFSYGNPYINWSSTDTLFWAQTNNGAGNAKKITIPKAYLDSTGNLTLNKIVVGNSVYTPTLSGNRATFNSLSGVHLGDGSSLVNLPAVKGVSSSLPVTLLTTPKVSSLGWNPGDMSNDGKYQLFGIYGGNLWRSADYGTTWSITNGNTIMNYGNVVVCDDGKIQYTVRRFGSVYKSTDYGVTFTTTTYPSLNYQRVAASQDGQYVLAAGDNTQIYTSSDGGVTVVTPTGSTNSVWIGASMSSNGKYQLVSSQSLMKISSDYGATFAQTGPPANFTGATISEDGSYAYATVFGGALYRSTDYGASFTAMSTAPSGVGWSGSIYISGDNSTVVVAISGSPLLVSTDYGANWKYSGLSKNWSGVAGTSDKKYFTGVENLGYIWPSPNGVKPNNIGDTSFGATTLYGSNPLAMDAPRTANYTLTITDAGGAIQMNTTSGVLSAIVPTNSNVAFTIGSQIKVIQTGTNAVSIVAATPATTILCSNSSKFRLNSQWATATLIKIATDTWVVTGDTVV